MGSMMDSDTAFMVETENYGFILFLYADESMAESMFREGFGVTEGNHIIDSGEIYGFVKNILWGAEQKFEPLATPVLVSYDEDTTQVELEYDEKATNGYNVRIFSFENGEEIHTYSFNTQSNVFKISETYDLYESLTPGVEYRIYVTARGVSGESENSDRTLITTVVPEKLATPVVTVQENGDYTITGQDNYTYHFYVREKSFTYSKTGSESIELARTGNLYDLFDFSDGVENVYIFAKGNKISLIDSNPYVHELEIYSLADPIINSFNESTGTVNITLPTEAKEYSINVYDADGNRYYINQYEGVSYSIYNNSYTFDLTLHKPTEPGTFTYKIIAGYTDEVGKGEYHRTKETTITTVTFTGVETVTPIVNYNQDTTDFTIENYEQNKRVVYRIYILGYDGYYQYGSDYGYKDPVNINTVLNNFGITGETIKVTFIDLTTSTTFTEAPIAQEVVVVENYSC